MRRQACVLVSVFLMASCGGGLSGGDGPHPLSDLPELLRADFEVLDTSGDGRLCAAELEELIRKEFTTLDRDGSGRIDGADFDDPDTLFAGQEFDVDHNGLTLDEYRLGIAGRGLPQDTDHDGCVTLEEIVNHAGKAP